MGSLAVGVYLRRLRDERNIGRHPFARLLGTSKSQIERIESGTHDVGYSQFFAVAQELKADLEHISSLMLMDDDIGTQEIAKALAEDQLASIKAGTTPSGVRLERHTRITGQLRAHPQQFDLWLGYGERLLDELGDSD